MNSNMAAGNIKTAFNMKFGLYISIFLIYSQASLGQSHEPMAVYTQKNQEKRSKLKLKAERMYVFPVEGKEGLEKKDSLRSEIFYNSFGKAVKSTSYFPGMTIVNETEYDNKGHELKSTNKDGKGEVRQTIVYTYNPDGTLSKTTYFDAAGQLTSAKDSNEKVVNGYKLSYDNKGAVVSKTYTNYDSLKRTYISRLLKPNGELRYENNYLLNDQMQILEWTVIDNVQNRKSKTIFKYDALGNRTEELKYDSNGNLSDKIMNLYDDKNLLFESYWYQPEKLKQISRYRFEF